VPASERAWQAAFNQQLGHGAFKAVFKGYDEEEGIEVAWCQVNMDRVGEVEKAQIHTEVDILKSLTHKHILTFFAYFDLPSTKQIVFITEIMTSGTLKQYIHKARRVKRKVVKKWCRQILDGLSFLHAKRIIHRDLKCDNIFINGNNSEIKIGDLGLSTLMREGQGQAQSVLGTPEFMAPELYDELYDEKVDIYAFGMCVLEMVTSEYPYSECLNAAQIYRKVTQRSKPASLQKIVDEQTKQFIEECLEHDHGIRPSATALLGHDYLQPPFGGPGTKDDEPVELLPKKDAATKDTVIREPLQLQPLLAIQPGQHQPSAPQPPLLAQQQLSQQQPTPPLLHAQPPRPMMSDCASSVARAPAAASPQSSSAPTTLPLRDVVAVECAHASRILPGVVSPMGDLLPAAAPSAPPTTTQGEGCCAHADLTSGNALAPALAPATCEFGPDTRTMLAIFSASSGFMVSAPSAVQARNGPSMMADISAFDNIWGFEAKKAIYDAWDPEKPRDYDNFNPFERNDEGSMADTNGCFPGQSRGYKSPLRPDQSWAIMQEEKVKMEELGKEPKFQSKGKPGNFSPKWQEKLGVVP